MAFGTLQDLHNKNGWALHCEVDEYFCVDFVDSVVEFYKTTDEHKRSFLLDLFGEPSKDKLLEQIIHKRIHIDDNIITKNFNHFLINAFLFIDIIGYHHFLMILWQFLEISQEFDLSYIRASLLHQYPLLVRP